MVCWKLVLAALEVEKLAPSLGSAIKEEGEETNRGSRGDCGWGAGGIGECHMGTPGSMNNIKVLVTSPLVT